MTWDEVCDDPTLANLPYKIETNGFGQIIMSPHKFKQSKSQVRIQKHLLRLLPQGEPYPEVAVQTSDGVKSADVAWASAELVAEVESGESGIFDRAPEICIEVISKSNPMAALLEKKKLYFEAGAQEFWLCDRKGSMTFFTPDGQVDRSLLCPEFPLEIG